MNKKDERTARPIRPRKLRRKVLLPMLAIVVLQMVLIASIIYGSGAITQLDQSALQMLSRNVDARRDNLQAQMLKWSEVNDAMYQIESFLSHTASTFNMDDKGILLNKDQRASLLRNVSNEVITLLRDSGATGAFIILENETGDNEKDAFYVRTQSPGSRRDNNSDLLGEAGPASIMRGLSITFDSYWGNRYVLPENAEFFYRPLEAARKYTDIASGDLGYWSQPFRPRAQDIAVITYTVPLRNEYHQPFGVLGVEISLTHLAAQLPSRELGIDSGGSYLLAVTEDEKRYTTVLAQGSYYQSKLPFGTQLDMLQDAHYNTFHSLELEGLPPTYAATAPLTLYNTNTPFVHEKWVLCGLGRAAAIEEYSHRLWMYLGIVLILSGICGLAGAWAVTSRMLRPIDRMMAHLQKSVSGHLELEETGIVEFDRLGDEIERLSIDIRRSASKLSRIIELSGITLGVMEYEENAAFVFCTKQVLELGELEGGILQDNYMERHAFLECMVQLGKKIERSEDNPDVYFMRTKSGEERWLRLRVTNEQAKTVCVVLDVTSDMLERRAIKRERDYDMLTDLLNRRAFATQLQTLLESGTVGVGIFSIWDLDNLKFLNDNYGHDMGDKYIRQMADVLRNFAAYKALVARMAGDEFMVFLYEENSCENPSGEDRLYNILTRMHQQLLDRTITMPDGDVFHMSASVGVCAYPQDADNYDGLMKLSDLAMYEVKNATKGGVQRFVKDTMLQNQIMEHGAQELSRILRDGLIRYAFQPVICVRDGTVFGYEALMRPSSDLLGSPLTLLRLATIEHKLNHVEYLVWVHALEDYFGQQCPDGEKYLFLNSLPGQCLRNSDFEMLEEQYGDKLHNVILEVSANIQGENKAVMRKGEWCAKWGVDIALDDFDSRSSFRTTLMPEAKYVKLDIYIVREIQKAGERQMMVRRIVERCHEADVAVIAKGVEKESELACLLELGVDFVQGYFFAAPDYKLNPPSAQALQTLARLREFMPKD